MHSFKIFSPPPFLFVHPKESSISKERQLMSKRSPSHAHTLITLQIQNTISQKLFYLSFRFELRKER